MFGNGSGSGSCFTNIICIARTKHLLWFVLFCCFLCILSPLFLLYPLIVSSPLIYSFIKSCIPCTPVSSLFIYACNLLWLRQTTIGPTIFLRKHLNQPKLPLYPSIEAIINGTVIIIIPTLTTPDIWDCQQLWLLWFILLCMFFSFMSFLFLFLFLFYSFFLFLCINNGIGTIQSSKPLYQLKLSFVF